MELSLARIAEVVKGEIKGDKNKNICGVAPFDDAKMKQMPGRLLFHAIFKLLQKTFYRWIIPSLLLPWF